MGIGKTFVRDENNHICSPITTFTVLKSQKPNQGLGDKKAVALGLWLLANGFFVFAKKVKFIHINLNNLPNEP
tara:strand:+ start:2306 stop:2524 length:219 start_codon:yes stop_codon:yes gene_type:complete